MAHPVWKARTSKPPDPLIVALCSGRDTAPVPPADEALLPHDIRLNMAHALMLSRQGIIGEETARRLLRGLRRLERRAARGRFALDPGAEDVHMNVEQALVTLAGQDAAGRLHTARSRNDQAATDMRLWLREQLGEAVDQILSLARALAMRARRDAAAVCPGFTHMQPAQVTTLGHLWASHAHALTRDAEVLLALTGALDKCPLGSAASFGTAWPVDRKFVARLLGFAAPSPNTLDAIANRWEPEARVAQAWTMALTHLSSLAQDVIWLSTPPREWIRIDDAHVTGSSIMPQKRNPDLAEVTRARAAAAQSAAQAILATATGQLSGYNRDLQWTKYHAMDTWAQIADVPEAWRRVIEGLTTNPRAMREACGVGFMEAADAADALCMATGRPFREMHGVVARAVERCEAAGELSLEAVNAALIEAKIKFQLSSKDWTALKNPAQRLKQRRHPGSPSPDMLRRDVRTLAKSQTAIQRRLSAWAGRIEKAAARLDKMVEEFVEA